LAAFPVELKKEGTMEKHELIKTAFTAIIAVLAKEALSWLITTSKKLARHGQARAASAHDAAKR
jgi:hypothetical protein